MPIKFHKTSLKLAGFYLAILMAISLFFSVAIYEVSINELQRGLRQPTRIVMTPDYPAPDDFMSRLQQERLGIYNEAKTRILTRLVITNLLILLGAGMLSYYLAVRTLKPIEEAHAALERFTADASHELRTPITAMRSENEVALMDPKLTLVDAKKQLQSNIEELENLTKLAEGLLQLAHTDNNVLQKTAVSAGLMVNNAVQRVLPLAEKRNILLSVTRTSDTAVLANEIGVTEAIVTLLDNAVKYSPEKSEVTIQVKPTGKQVSFIVKDKGVGIAADELPHIFDRFYRADSSRTKQGVSGYGLGLAIAQSVAHAHHGSLTATSKPGKGSIFTLALPVAHEPESA